MPKRPSHTHKLRRHKYPTGNVIFFCILPDCHFKIEAALTLGKKTICNICGAEFIMTEYTIKLVKPHCLDCGRVRVVDGEGNRRYVKKVTNRILSGIASDTNEDLRSRLASVTSGEVEDDI